MGASFGAAFLAAGAVAEVSIDVWNPPAGLVRARPELSSTYDELYDLYRDLYSASATVVHALSARQLRNTP